MPGTEDANGIYQFAEDDTAATFSDMMDKLTVPLSTAVGALKAKGNSNTALIADLGRWQPYTPTANANLTVGVGGSLVGRYMKIGDTVVADVGFTLGSSGFAVAGDVTLTLPFTPRDPYAVGQGIARISTSGAAYAVTAVTLSGSVTSSLYLRYLGASGILTAFGAAAPATWAAGGRARVVVTYEVP